jgi:hypothetical protein
VLAGSLWPLDYGYWSRMILLSCYSEGVYNRRI